MLPSVPGISKKRRCPALPPEPSLKSTVRPDHLHAALAQRNDELAGSRMVAHGLPVVAAFGAGTGLNPLAGLLLEDVAAIGRLARLRIDPREDVLEDGFLEGEELAGLAVELPQDAGLADGEQQLLAAAVDQHALEHFVQVERFAGHVLEIPGQLAVVGIQRQRRAGEERLVARLGAAAGAHPGLGLRDAPVGQVELGIVAAGDPGVAAGAQQVRQRAPGVAARLRLRAPRSETSRAACRCPRRRR